MMIEASRPGPARGVFYGIFALSGFSGLIYESIWTHYLKLFLGHAAYAQTLVLVIFMGGMALGSWLCGQLSGRWRRLLLGYAVIEGIVGLFALAFPDAFIRLTDWFFIDASPALGSSDALMLVKWGLATLLILPQSILLGMTFPLISAGIVRRFPERSGQTIARLYFANSLGGALGVLVSGFVLIKAVGLPGTIMTAGAINLTLALLVWLRCGRQVDPLPAPLDAPAQEAPFFLTLLLSVALLTGLSSFAYEIGWIRLLSLVLGSSTHAFELMLSTFISGLALGGLWVGRRIDRLPNPLGTLGWIQLAMGLLALLTLPLYGQSFAIMEWLVAVLPKTDAGYFGFNAASHLIASLIMLPATFCAGMTLPLITHILLSSGAGERSIGFVYGANTLGAICGALLAVHAALPLIGLKGLIVGGGVIDIALGIYLLRRCARPAVTRQARAAVLLAAALCLSELDQAKMASGVFHANPSGKQIEDVVFYQEGKTASIAVTRNAENMLSLRTNGKTDASIDLKENYYSLDETTMTLLGALPLMLKPETRTVANIGLGSGITTHTLLASPVVSRVDTIEIEPAIREGAKIFQERNQRAFADPRSRIVIEDAKTFFSTQGERYDLIVSEPSNPWVSGVSGLFSVEFYRLLKRHLASDGLFVQWLQLYEIDLERVASVMKALDQNFSDYAIYAANFGDIMIIATPNGVLPEIPATLPELPLLRSALARLDIVTAQDLAIRKLGTRKLFAPWLAQSAAPANSDYQPYLDQHAGRDRFMDQNSAELINLTMNALPISEMLGSPLLWSSSTVTPAPHWAQPHPAFGATVLRDLLLQRQLTPPPNMSSDDWQQAIARATFLINRCNTPAHDEALAALFDFARATIPHLRPQENAQLLRAIGNAACATQLTEVERPWLTLIGAVGQRDGEAMARTATALLDAGLAATPAQQRYLLAAAMLGELSSNHSSAAGALWRKFAPPLFGDTLPPLIFRLMAA